MPPSRAWQRARRGFVGGTLKGIESKLDSLQGLGVTTLWIGPLWRQRPDLDTCHGYGIHDFLDVDPRFGSRQDLRWLGGRRLAPPGHPPALAAPQRVIRHPAAPPANEAIEVVHRQGRATVRIDLPPAGMAVLAAASP